MKDYWSLAGCIWPQHAHLCAINYTQQWIAKQEREMQLKIVAKYLDKKEKLIIFLSIVQGLPPFLKALDESSFLAN